jgi:presenilin-like A22 family membrane protease
MKFKISTFVKTLILFGLTQILGIYLAMQILPAIGVQTISASSFSLGDFIYLAAIVFLFFFFSIKYPRVGSAIYRVFLSLVIFAAMETFASIWLDPLSSLCLALAVLIIFWLWQSVIVQDVVMIITLGAVGAIFGLSLTPITVVYILIIFSAYDIFAVYVTGHMVKMAEAMIKSRAIFGFIIPSSVKDFGNRMQTVQPGEQFMVLGSGDVIFPLIMTVSLVRTSLTQALIVFVFSLLGILATHLIFVNQKIRRQMAALPPIATLTIIGYLVSRLF